MSTARRLLLWLPMSTWLPLVTAASPVPDPEVGAIVDQVARQFAEANGRGFEGWEPKLLKEAARNYHAKITPMAMPWPVDQGTAETFVPPEGVAPRVPNIAHWAWRSGDADWTMALSVVMARVVQRAETLYLHTGPLGDGDWSYTSPRTAAGAEALRCIRAAGATEYAHDADPTPDPSGRHPWAEVMHHKPGHDFSKQTFAHVSDVMRLYTILKHGGIYLDRDAQGRTRVIQRRFNVSVPRARVPEKHPRFETVPRDDRSSKDQPKRVENGRDMRL